MKTAILSHSVLALTFGLFACSTPSTSRHISSFGKQKKDAEDFSCTGAKRKFDVKWNPSTDCHQLTVSGLPGTFCLSGGDVGHLSFTSPDDKYNDQYAKSVTIYVFGKNSYTNIADGSFYGARHEVDDAACTIDLRAGAE
jgi:hypothetical protein